MSNKLLSVILVSILIFSLTACGKAANSSSDESTSISDAGDWLSFSTKDASESKETTDNSVSKETENSSNQINNSSNQSNPTSNNESESSNVTVTSSETNKEEITKKNFKIVYFGDSVTFRGDTNKSYATYASQSLNNTQLFNITAVNKGVPGNTVSDLYARLEKDVISENPNVVSILIGVNDTATYQKNISDEEFKTVYKNIITTIKAKLPNTKIILMTPFIFKKNGSYSIDVLQGRINAVKELATQYTLTLVDTNALIVSKQQSGQIDIYADDGVHPNANGAKLIAEEWIKGTKNIFK